jgi:solute carrier family 25 carnitine/acylcarnitine transporter 20/29
VYLGIASYPMDVIKSRMQTDHLDPAQRKYKNMIHCAKSLWATGGLRSFFVGFTPCLMRAFPANGACFMAYEASKKFLEKL